MNRLPLVAIALALVPMQMTCIGSDGARMELPGLATAKESVTIRVPAIGKVKQVLVHDGQWVRANDVIIQLDDQEARAGLAILEAEASQQGRLKFAHADVEHAKQILERLLAVDNHHHLPQNEIDAARNNLRKAEATLRTAEEESQHANRRLELERLKLERMRITAPFDGIASRVRIKAGDIADPNQELLTVVNLTVLSVELQIAIEHYSRLNIGEEYQLRALEPISRDITAKLTAVDPVLEAGTQTVRCLFEIDNKDLALPGGFLLLPPAELCVPTDTSTDQLGDDQALVSPDDLHRWSAYPRKWLENLSIIRSGPSNDT